MRNKHRIQPIIEMLGQYWEMYPDMRFFQMIHNISHFTGYKDPYHCEDNVIERILSDLIMEAQLKKNKLKDTYYICGEDWGRIRYIKVSEIVHQSGKRGLVSTEYDEEAGKFVRNNRLVQEIALDNDNWAREVDESEFNIALLETTLRKWGK